MIRRLDVFQAKASYLLTYATDAGQGGDKRTFWRDIPGFYSSDDLRDALLAGVSVGDRGIRTRTPYGDLYPDPNRLDRAFR